MAEAERVLGKPIEREYALTELLRRPNVSYKQLMTLTCIDGRRFDQPELNAAAADQVEIQIKYAGYIDRQAKEVERHEHYEGMRLPDELDYMGVRALSMEVRQKLTRHRPETLGQASRIAGVTPAAISLLLVHLKKGIFKQSVAANDNSDAA